MVGVMGLLLAVGVPIYWWQVKILRLIPFLYATSFSLFGFATAAESVSDLVMRVLVMNSVTAGILFFAWLQCRK
jgi:hypothetical protein